MMFQRVLCAALSVFTVPMTIVLFRFTDLVILWIWIFSNGSSKTRMSAKLILTVLLLHVLYSSVQFVVNKSAARQNYMTISLTRTAISSSTSVRCV